MFERLRQLEEGISTVRKHHIPTWFHNIEYQEEILIIKYAKHEHLPIFAELSGKALLDKDEDFFWHAISEGVIDKISVIEGLEIFLKASVEHYRITTEKMTQILDESIKKDYIVS